MSIDPRMLAQMQGHLQAQSNLAPQGPLSGEQAGPIPPQQPPAPDPVQAITELLIKTVNNMGLNTDVQSKAILTLAQAITALQTSQPEQIPAQAQFEMEVAKMKLEHGLKQQEMEHKIQLETQAQQHKMGLEAQKAQADMMIKQQQANQQAGLQERQAQMNEAKTAHDQSMKQESNDASIEAQKKQAAQKPKADK